MNRPLSRRFDPIDFEYMCLWVQLSPGAHLQAMLGAREWVVGAFRSQLPQHYPDLSPEELNLKALDEIER